jgi:RNA-directed DNA polymerase
VTGDCHAPFRGSLGVRFPRATRRCKDKNRRGSHEHTEFSFLGFTFRQRGARDRGGTLFNSFQPAISMDDALNRINTDARSWRLHNRTGHDLLVS